MPCRSGSSVAVAAARPRSAVLGSLTAAAAANTLPALAPLAPPLARALRIPRTLGGDGVALTFDDGPHPEGTVAVLEGLREAAAPPPSSSSASRCGATPRSPPRSSPPGTPWSCTATATATSCGSPRRRWSRTCAAAPPRSRTPAAAPRASTGRPTGSSRPPVSGPSIAPAGGRCCGPVGARLEAVRDAASIAAEASRDLGAGDVVLLHDSDAYSATGSWVNTAGALPAILEQIERGGLSPVGLA